MKLTLPRMRIAGVTIAGLNNEPYVVSVASVVDWRECLERARHRFSLGGALVPRDLHEGLFPDRNDVGPVTWEEALAWQAASLLGSGSDYTYDPAMGRPDPWPLGEEERWIDLVFEVAALGSAHEKIVGVETTDTPTDDVWLLEGVETPGPLAFRRLRRVLSGTVTRLGDPDGRVAIADLPRSTR